MLSDCISGVCKFVNLKESLYPERVRKRDLILLLLMYDANKLELEAKTNYT